MNRYLKEEALMNQKYIVLIEYIDGRTAKKSYDNYRDSLCTATDYARVKASKIIQQELLLNEFKF